MPDTLGVELFERKNIATLDNGKVKCTVCGVEQATANKQATAAFIVQHRLPHEPPAPPP